MGPSVPSLRPAQDMYDNRVMGTGETSQTASGSRRLTAVMFLDMVGYSALMARNEEMGMRCVKALEGIVRTEVPGAGGRIVKLLGDGSMAEFSTAEAAAACALKIQTAVALRNAAGSPDQFEIRIGLHVGDVMEEGSDLFGDAVNIAARIMPFSDPGGITMTEAVHVQVENWPGLKGTYLKGIKLKNIPGRVAVFAVPPPRVSYIGWYVGKHRGMVTTAAVLLLGAVGYLAALWWMQPKETLLEDCTDLKDIWVYGSGATIQVSVDPVPGKSMKAMALFYNGTGDQPWGWGAVKRADAVNNGDWSGYNSLRIPLKSERRLPISLYLVERSVSDPTQDGEWWVCEVVPQQFWSVLTIPFSAFAKWKDYQPAGQDNDWVLDLDNLAELHFGTAKPGTDRVYIGPIHLSAALANHAPDPPSQPLGPQRITVWSPCAYRITATDPDGDHLRLAIDWGDGTVTEDVPVQSSHSLKMEHVWAKEGTYIIKARAMDSTGDTSEWSKELSVTVVTGEALLDDFEDVADWGRKFNGIDLTVCTGPGRTGQAMTIKFCGVRDVTMYYWTVVKMVDMIAGGDLSGFESVRFWLRSEKGVPININLSDGKVDYTFPLSPTAEWTLVTVPFSSCRSKDGLKVNPAFVSWIGFTFTPTTTCDAFSADELVLVPKP